MAGMPDTLAEWAERARQAAQMAEVAANLDEVGIVERIGDGVAILTGLPHLKQDELIRFDTGALAQAVTLESERIGAVMLSPYEDIVAGSSARRTGEVISVGVGDALLGRVVDPLGRPLDGGPAPQATRFEPVERPAPAIVDRDLVTRPLVTGITVIDAMLPIGRGQRELIVGDRKTGKSAIALDSVINQKTSDVICVWASIGQKSTSVARVMDAVAQLGPKSRTIIVVADPAGPPGLAWLAPYAACTMAEYFRDKGGHALLVLDDLTKHAAIHREVSLLLRRPPGREAYPGDIFYTHSRLLERGAQLSSEGGGGSLTILPIAETQGGNLTAYIPTNLISITDGQIILEEKLFFEGQKPAVNVGLSVSRVGGKAQVPGLRDLAGSLKLDYAQFTELELFTRFGTMADERTRRIVEHGRRVRQILIQPNLRPRGLAEEIAGLLALKEGLLDELAPAAVEAFKQGLAGWLDEACPHLGPALAAEGRLSAEDQAELLGRLRQFTSSLAGKEGTG